MEYIFKKMSELFGSSLYYINLTVKSTGKTSLDPTKYSF